MPRELCSRHPGHGTHIDSAQFGIARPRRVRQDRRRLPVLHHAVSAEHLVGARLRACLQESRTPACSSPQHRDALAWPGVAKSIVSAGTDAGNRSPQSFGAMWLRPGPRSGGPDPARRSLLPRGPGKSHAAKRCGCRDRSRMRNCGMRPEIRCCNPCQLLRASRNLGQGCLKRRNLPSPGNGRRGLRPSSPWKLPGCVPRPGQRLSAKGPESPFLRE